MCIVSADSERMNSLSHIYIYVCIYVYMYDLLIIFPTFQNSLLLSFNTIVSSMIHSNIYSKQIVTMDLYWIHNQICLHIHLYVHLIHLSIYLSIHEPPYTSSILSIPIIHFFTQFFIKPMIYKSRELWTHG
jgi:hypothetical protein